MTRAGEQDVMTLLAEAETVDAGALANSLQDVTKLRGAVERMAPGQLPRDGKIISDERPPA